MTKPTQVLAFLLALMTALLISLADLAHADEAVKEDTAAGKAFREAWWAETGSGALDKALEGYRKAVDAEGSKAVKAKALYRMGIVLQRMGRTDEALQALGRLAKEFPQQTALHAKAQARLDEWTAVDLKTSFPEWYRRYQYSPEFQAKIVDLVLKLGDRTNNTAQSAKQELLTIGEPAVAALQAHSTSANVSIRRHVQEVLIDLGHMPPAASLLKNPGWQNRREFWVLVRGADAKDRAMLETLVAEQPDHWAAKMITAGLAGREGVVKHMRTKNAGSVTVEAMLEAWLGDDPDAAFFAELRAMVRDEAVNDHARAALAKRLLASYPVVDGEDPQPFGVTPDDVIAWATSDARGVRSVAWAAMRLAATKDPRAVDAVAQYILDLRNILSDIKSTSGALFGLLRMQGEGFDTSKAVAAVRRVLNTTSLNSMDTYPLGEWGKGSRGAPDVPIAVVAEALTGAQGHSVQSSLNKWFYQAGGQRNEAAFDQLMAWAVGAKDANARREAWSLAGRFATDRTTDLLAPMLQEGIDQQQAYGLFRGLQTNQNLSRLDWNVESITRLVEAARRASGNRRGRARWATSRGGVGIAAQTTYSNQVANVMGAILHDPQIQPLFFESARTHPTRFDPALWLMLGEAWLADAANRARAQQALRKGWDAWRPEQREAGLKALLTDRIAVRDDEAFEASLRSYLAAEGNSSAVRTHLLWWIRTLSLEDVAKAFDLTKFEELDAAARLVSKLPVTREVYDAFRPTLRPAGKHYTYVYQRFRHAKEDDLVHDLLMHMLAHESDGAINLATQLLTKRRSSIDLGVWIGALQHEQARVRNLAAQRLGVLYNDDVIKALAKAVDDPDPDVRDAALASLEKIEKTEKQKERWRKFAEDK